MFDKNASSILVYVLIIVGLITIFGFLNDFSSSKINACVDSRIYKTTGVGKDMPLDTIIDRRLERIILPEIKHIEYLISEHLSEQERQAAETKYNLFRKNSP